MNEEDRRGCVERVIVALDASPQSVAALEAAAEVAMLIEAELEGLFVEDIDLLSLCGLPFGREVCSYTATVRRLDAAGMERQLRVRAATIREVMGRVAARTPVRWSFRVARGSVVEELLAAAQGAALLSVGRTGRAGLRGMGSVAQSLIDQTERPLLISGEGTGPGLPLTVSYTGTSAARRALELALRLSRREPARLRVVVWDGGDVSLDVGRLEQDVRRLLQPVEVGGQDPPVVMQVSRSADMAATLRDLGGCGTLVAPREQADLVAHYGGPALLVP